MSYYTHVEFQYSEEPPTFDQILPKMRQHLDAQNCYATEAVLSDVRLGWEKGQTDFNGLVSQDVEALISVVSTAFPNLRVYVRGWGEEFRDIWVREFEGGKVVYAVGPFESS